MDRRLFVTLESRPIYQDAVLALRQDVVRTPEGVDILRKVIEYRHASAIVPLTDDRRILMIHHYRHPIHMEIWDIPGGFVEEGETEAQCAARELREETGYSASRVEHLVDFNPDPAFSNHSISIYLATGIRPEPRPTPEQESEIGEIALFPLTEAMDMIQDGRVRSSWTIIGILTSLVI